LGLALGKIETMTTLAAATDALAKSRKKLGFF